MTIEEKQIDAADLADLIKCYDEQRFVHTHAYRFLAHIAYQEQELAANQETVGKLPKDDEGESLLPGDEVYSVETTDGGKTWFIKSTRVAAINICGVQLLDRDNWIMTPDARLFKRHEAAITRAATEASA